LEWDCQPDTPLKPGFAIEIAGLQQQAVGIASCRCAEVGHEAKDLGLDNSGSFNCAMPARDESRCETVKSGRYSKVGCGGIKTWKNIS
jgi:hypothetical protein